MTQANHLRRIRLWLAIFIAGLIVSGITAFPLQTELGGVISILGGDRMSKPAEFARILPWMRHVGEALGVTNANYPFLAYGTDWLAFAHIVIAIAFVGPYVDPVRNKWVVAFGLIACAGILPVALIAGHIRGIPFPWRLVDCSFGVFGAIPLLLCWRSIVLLEQQRL